MGFDDIGDDDVPHVLALYGNVNDGARAVAGNVWHAQMIHEFAIARGHLLPVHGSNHTIAADLLNVFHAAAVDGLAVGLLQALADGMGRSALGQRRILHQLGVLYLAVMDAVHFKHATRQRTRFVEHHDFGLGQGFQIIGTLHQHTRLAGPADAGKKAERNADDQRARAAGHQKGERPVNPSLPRGISSHAQHEHQWGKDRQRQGGIAYRWRVDSGKAGNKVLGLGFAGRGVFHQVQNFRNGGFPKSLVVWIFSTPVILMQPLMISFPTRTSLGRDSR